MLLLLYFSCLLVASNTQTIGQGLESENVDDVINIQPDTNLKHFWKVIFTTYYDMKGLRNETTDNLVEAFFEHKFEAYPKELYPVFKRIFVHISKSNDRIWNFYESILYLYHNVDAADRIYETVLRRLALGNLLKDSGELDLEAASSTVEPTDSEYSTLQHRSGEMFQEGEVPDFEPCEGDCGMPSLQVGSIRAVPGVHFPNYDEIPITAFTCAGKHIPGFYADLETGCQVFHVCYPHRRESFLCPIGTTFNQAILACDYWYSSNCSLAPLYFISTSLALDEFLTDDKESFVDHLLEQYGTLDTASTATEKHVDYPIREPEEKKSEKPKSPKIKITLPNVDWSLMIKFLPIKSKITEGPDFCETTKSAILTESTPDESPSLPIVTPMVATVPPTQEKYATTRPVVTAPLSPKEYKYSEKAGKSEILLDILKAVKVLTKDAEGFLTEMLEKKRGHDVPAKKQTISPPFPENSKPFPEINPRFVMKPANAGQHLPRPTVSRSKSLNPSKQILKSQVQDAFRQKPAKLVQGGMKVLSHLFD